MKKIKLPKKPYRGLKVYCTVCNEENPVCKHYDSLCFRARIHVPGTKNTVKIKTFDTKDYAEAVRQTIEFKKEISSEIIPSKVEIQPTEVYTLTEAIEVYDQYLSGNHPLAHKKKSVSDKHKYECIHFCEMFANIVKKRTDISKLYVTDVTKYDVSNFYKWLGAKYAPKTFNKAMIALKAFFKFLIDDEEILMRNPFASYVSKKIPKKNILSLSKDEFAKILDVIGTVDPYQKLKRDARRNRNIRKSRYTPYLKDGLKLCLYTGLRREEVVELRWSDIYRTESGTLFFKLHNLKVERSQDSNNIPKFVPIYPDLYELLKELGLEAMKESTDYIINPERSETHYTIMDNLSKGFTHYRKAAGIERPFTLKHLRKTYLSWVNEALGKETGKITSHASHKILENHYIDPYVSTLIDKGALEIRIFGK